MHAVAHHEGSLAAAVAEMSASAPGPYLARIFPVPSARAVQLLCAYGLFQALLLVFMPGSVFHGPVTAGGNRPVYKARGRGAPRCGPPVAAPR